MVSVVVPVFNVEAFLPRCVESLRSQTWRELEILLVDDGSTDGSGRLCDEYAVLDSRVHVIRQENAGLSAARNAGLRVARGDYVAFLDSDDWAEPMMLEEMLEAAQADGSDIVVAGCWVDVEDDAGEVVLSERRTVGAHVLGPGSGCTELGGRLLNLLGYAWNKLYRRDVLERHQLRFEEGLSLVEDAVFNAAVVEHSRRIQVLPRAYVHYVQRPRRTLGVQHYEDFLSLRFRAIASLDSMLGHWGVQAADRRRVLAPERQAAVRNVVRRTVEQQTWSLRRQVRHLAQVRSELDRDTRGVIVVRGAGTLAGRAYVRIFVRGPVTLLVVAERIRRWSKTRGTRSH